MLRLLIWLAGPLQLFGASLFMVRDYDEAEGPDGWIYRTPRGRGRLCLARVYDPREDRKEVAPCP